MQGDDNSMEQKIDKEVFDKEFLEQLYDEVISTWR